MVVIFLAMNRWPIGPLRGIEGLFEKDDRTLFRECNIIDLALISLLAGFGEELMFRGFLRPPVLSYWWGAWLGIAATSVLFGLVHPFGLTYVVLAASRFYLGVLVWLTGKLPGCGAGACGFYDFVALVVLTHPQNDCFHHG